MHLILQIGISRVTECVHKVGFPKSGHIWFVLAVVLNNENKFIASCKVNSLGVVWCSYNEWINRLRVYRCLLTNRLHGKAAA